MKYLNVAFIALFLLFAVGCSTMQDPISATTSSEDGIEIKDGRSIAAPGPITYAIELVSTEYDENSDATTFTYSVLSNPDGGPAISHWVIGFAEDCGSSSIIVDSSDPLVEWNESDPTTGVRGIKFDTGYDDEELREVSLTLAGEWALGDVEIAVKSGNGFVLGVVQGPVCGEGSGGGGDDEEPVYNISGVVFYDLNDNGVQDAGEPGIEGVEVSLSTGTVLFTDADGGYLFIELPAGDYNVTVGEHNNRDHTTPASVDVTIVDEDVVVHFGFAGYEISGVVYFDVNGNGVQDADEPGLEGVEVTLSNGESVLTDADGSYLFDGLLPGDYTVDVEELDGFSSTTGTSADVSITVDDASADFGFAIDFEGMCGAVADGFTIGFWKNNIGKAIAGKSKGVQIDAATLEGYVSELSTFGLYPLNFGSLEDAYDVLSANGSNEIVLLSKQLAGSEFNFANGAYINGNELLTWAFVYWGEYIIANASDYSRDEVLAAKDWFDAYNNSHGGAFYGPDCNY